MSGDQKPLLDPEKNQNESIYAASSQSEAVDFDKSTEEWDKEKYIWDRDDLEEINKRRDVKEVMPSIYRNKESYFGIRSNEDLTAWMCFKSVFIPWQNEFVCIWIYFIFSCYFWYQLIILSIPTKQYDFNNKEDFEYMFIATIGICISLTMTTCYLIFYPINKEIHKILETFNYVGILVMLFSYSFAFYCSEFVQEEITQRFYCFFLTVVIGIGCLVILQYDFGRLLSTCIAGVFLGVLYALDFLFLSDKRQTNIFYVPAIVEGCFLGLGIIIMVFNLPERWFKRNKFVSLYLNSHIIYALILVNVIYEMHFVLYLTLKLNSGNIGTQELAWYQVDNVYNTAN